MRGRVAPSGGLAGRQLCDLCRSLSGVETSMPGQTGAWLFQPKRPQKIPQVLTEEEVVKLITAIDNLKHRCILALI